MRKGQNTRRKVLVVDDDAFIRTLLVAWLQEAGYAVVTAEDGQEALALVLRERPDVVLLDLMLPKLDGYSVAKMIRYHDDTRRMPIIVLSADIRAPQKLNGIVIDGYLSKPFDLDEVLARVSEFAPVDQLSAAV